MGDSAAYPHLRVPVATLDAMEAAIAHHSNAAAHYKARERAYRINADEIGKTCGGEWPADAVDAHLLRAAAHRKRASVHDAICRGRRDLVNLGRDLNRALDQIHHETQQRAAAAPPAERPQILAAGTAFATQEHAAFAAGAAAAHARTMTKIGPHITHLLGRDFKLGGGDKLPATGHDAARSDTSAPDRTDGAGGAKASAEDKAASGHAARPDTSAPDRTDGAGGAAHESLTGVAGAPPGTGVAGTAVAGSVPREEGGALGSGLSGFSRLPASGSGGGGLGKIGSGGSSVAGLGNLTSGGVGGAGGPAGLSPLASGGGEPSALGLSSAGAQPGPGAAIARSFGGGIGAAAVGNVAPPAVSGVSAAGGHSAPAASVSGISPSSLSAGGSPGQVPPAAVGPAGSVGAGTSAGVPAVVSPAASGGGGVASAAVPPAMLVPPPGMAAPAAPVVPSTPVSPASAGGGAASSSGGGVPGGGVVGAGPGIVPAGVPIASSTPVDPRDSADLAAVKAVAMQLRRDSDAVGAVMEWAVGIFRAPGAATAETVVVGSQGAYIPWGVYLPRGVRLLWSDALTRNDFEERWTGWPDPARVLGAYAALRAEHGHGRMVAAAATDRVAPLREAADESALCPPRDGKRVALPVLDAMHVDRWELAWPDLSARVSRLLSAGRSLDAVVREMAASMMHGVVSQSAPCPPALRDMWGRVSATEVVSQEDWEAFGAAASHEAMLAVLAALAAGEDPEAREWRRGWQQQWLIARTMEVVSGWRYSRLPIGDMLYAASMAHQGDFAARLANLIRPLEAGL